MTGHSVGTPRALNAVVRFQLLPLIDESSLSRYAEGGPSAAIVIGMKTYNFKVVVEQDEDFDGNPSGWHAYCPALENVGGSTWGETKEDALKNISDVVRMIVEEFVEDGTPLPEGPGDTVEVEEVSLEEPRIAVTV